MTLWSQLRSWLRMILRRSRMESDMDAELQFHLEAYAADAIRSGVPRHEALRRARTAFGGVDRTKDACRDARGANLVDNLVHDLRFAARMLRKNPGFTAVAVLTLALGIGANAAIFSALNTLLLRPLPVPDVERIAFIVSLREGFDPFGTSFLEYTTYRDRSHSFASIGLATDRAFNVVERGEPERVPGAAIEAHYLATLGVRPALGRGFTPQEDGPGGPAVALLGYGFWQRRFGGDPHLVGQSLTLDGRPTTIVGILPPAFDLPDAAQIWVPLQTNIDGLPFTERSKPCCDLVARLKPGVTLHQADTELKGIARALEREFPQTRSGWGVKGISLRQELIGDVDGQIRKALLAVVAAVGFLLLICCANVASLLLARGVTRQREIALRRALGAGRGRVVRQLMTESLVLAMLGGLAGLSLAYAMVPLLRALSPIQTVALAGVLGNIRIDAHVLGFVVCMTLFTALVCAVFPVAKAPGAGLLPLLKEGGQRGSTGSAGGRWLATLVVAELSIAVPLLVGGGLMIRSFQRLEHVEVGFRPDHLLTMHLDLSPAKYPQYRQRMTFVQQLLDRVKTLPGVVSAGTTTNMPLTLFVTYDAVFSVEGRPSVNPADVPITSHRIVSPAYLQTLGVTLVKGRLLNEQDRENTLPVAVISEELARQGWGWPAQDPVGKRIKRVRAGDAFPWLTVVGVVKDVKEDRYNFRISRPVWYLPYEQCDNTLPLDLVVKASGDPASLTAAIREAVYSVDPGQPISNVISMSTHLAGVLVTERFSAVLMGALAALGLALAGIGLYGVMAYSVTRQTREMGLRMALGARPQDILRMVVDRGARLIAGGLILGLAGALTLTRFLSGALYDVNPNDLATFVGVSALLATVALAACYFPARRATKVDPIVALSHD